uniref:Uncharacterized protein n=1 Tax=Chlamydomonas euryale TaxID=1486919 RepID=A0A7R9VNM2_9CHLO
MPVALEHGPDGWALPPDVVTWRERPATAAGALQPTSLRSSLEGEGLTPIGNATARSIRRPSIAFKSRPLTSHCTALGEGSGGGSGGSGGGEGRRGHSPQLPSPKAGFCSSLYTSGGAAAVAAAAAAAATSLPASCARRQCCATSRTCRVEALGVG